MVLGFQVPSLGLRDLETKPPVRVFSAWKGWASKALAAAKVLSGGMPGGTFARALVRREWPPCARGEEQR
jgi:hypothetical protein